MSAPVDPSVTAAFEYLATAPHRRGEMTIESFKCDFAGHLRHSLAKDRYTATARDKYTALALAVRDRLVTSWIKTQQTHHDRDAKRVYYLSLEYLMGRALMNNVCNMGGEPLVRQAMEELGVDLEALSELEGDAGLGNGGLGRLAACFLDSLATLDLPAMGYGLRYDYGIFRQTIKDGCQFEEPDAWLRHGNPWEMPRPEYSQVVHFGGRVKVVRSGAREERKWVETDTVIGLPYDTPVVGFGCNTVNNLRLWSAQAREDFDFADFNRGNYFGAVEDKNLAESITKVLYPNDNNYQGKDLRFRQQYFFVSCALQDILRRYLASHRSFDALGDKIAIQLNDTHPAFAIPELMRLLVDAHGLGWEQAWELTSAVTAYTNHTLLPEALERWPVEFFERHLPRHLEIVLEINRRFLRQVRTHFPHDEDRVRRMSLIEESGPSGRMVRMAHLSIVGSRSVNGVAALHTQLLQTQLFKDFHEMFPERFNNKTNGITPRRWLRVANPGLSALVTEQLGEGWARDLDQLRGLEAAADDAAFCDAFGRVKRRNKERLAQYVLEHTGVRLSPDAIFDVQVKRIHEYKRQLLNIMHVVMLYNRLKQDPHLDLVPRAFIFGGKAAPGYFMAKRTIMAINAVAEVINADDTLDGRLKVVFVPNYGVSLAERIIPAADVSQQISTAGMEASGTGNMKFALNGALTVGTLDGANVEIREAVGPEHIFIFGHTAEEVEARRQDPDEHPRRHYEADDEIRETCDLMFGNFFTADQPGMFDPIRQAVLDGRDRYLCLSDMRSYADSMARTDTLYRDRRAWLRSAVLNTARVGPFSSDRTIREYNRDIWRLTPVPVEP